MEILKLDESCSSNPKSEIANWTGSKSEDGSGFGQSNLRFRISDLSCRIRPISKFLPRRRLVHSHFHAHPRMNAALEFHRLTRWKNGTARSWTLFFFSRLYEDIRRTVRLWLEHRAWNEYHACRALWSRDRV